MDLKWNRAAVSRSSNALRISKSGGYDICRKKLYYERDSLYGKLWGILACEKEATNMLTNLRCTKKEREIAASSRHEIPQFASTGTKIQDGRARNVVYNGTRRGLYVYGRSTRWLLPY